MSPYFRHPVLRAILAFGVAFFVGSLLWIAAHFYGLDSFLFPPSASPLSQEKEPRTNFTNLPYIDKSNQRIWFFQSLDLARGKAEGVEILFRDAEGHELRKYFAHEATWNGTSWKLLGVTEVIFGANDKVEKHDSVDLPDITTSPTEMVPHH